jgi:hypothetical protein
MARLHDPETRNRLGLSIRNVPMGKDFRTEIPVCRSLLASRAMHVFSSESQRSEITNVDVSVAAQSVVAVRSAFRQHAATEVGVLVRSASLNKGVKNTNSDFRFLTTFFPRYRFRAASLGHRCCLSL